MFLNDHATDRDPASVFRQRVFDTLDQIFIWRDDTEVFCLPRETKLRLEQFSLQDQLIQRPFRLRKPEFGYKVEKLVFCELGNDEQNQANHFGEHGITEFWLRLYRLKLNKKGIRSRVVPEADKGHYL
jgi:hypothetical protein